MCTRSSNKMMKICVRLAADGFMRRRLFIAMCGARMRNFRIARRCTGDVLCVDVCKEELLAVINSSDFVNASEMYSRATTALSRSRCETPRSDVVWLNTAKKTDVFLVGTFDLSVKS